MTATSPNIESQLADEVANYYADPLGFVRFAYPWGEKGTILEDQSGPDEWQREFLKDLGQLVRERKFNGKDPVAPIRMAVSSGHGIGKSTLVAWLVNWLMSTRPYAVGTVTANTFSQLETKTWPQIVKWAKLLINQHWFNISGSAINAKISPKNWVFTPQTCKEENSEAFAGQHAANSSSVYVFDEASAIPDAICEVAEGGQTDGEPFWFLLGNPTRRTGRFFEAVFGNDRHRWNSRCIDSRQSRFANKALIAEWQEKYGEDSDWFRVRVRGLAPRAGDQQYISSEAVYLAQKRQVQVLPDEPLIMGVDYARGGGDDNVIRFRRGLDGRSIPAIRIPGEVARDSFLMVSKIVDQIALKKPQAVFADATGGSIGGPINDRLRTLGHKVIDVQFGGKSPDEHYANMRAYMWAKMRDWLNRGAIDATPDLEVDLTGPGYGNDKQDRLLLESKEDMKRRGLDSPDDGDALAMTFAQPVSVRKPSVHRRPVVVSAWS